MRQEHLCLYQVPFVNVDAKIGVASGKGQSFLLVAASCPPLQPFSSAPALLCIYSTCFIASPIRLISQTLQTFTSFMQTSTALQTLPFYRLCSTNVTSCANEGKQSNNMHKRRLQHVETLKVGNPGCTSHIVIWYCSKAVK